MKTLYKQISFLLIGLFINIFDASSNNISGNEPYYLKPANNNNILSFNCKDPDMNGNTNNFYLHSFLPENETYIVEGSVKEINQISDLTTNVNAFTPENIADAPIATKGSYTGCNMYKYQYKNGVLLPNSKIRYYLYKYNHKGYPVEITYYEPDSKNVYLETYAYDRNGCLTGEVQYFADGSVGGSITYRYDENKNLNQQVWYEGINRVRNMETYLYDKQNNLIENIQYFGRDTMVGRDYFKFNENGKVIEHKGFDSDGMVRDLETYNYDMKGQLIDKDRYSNNSTVNHQNIYKYDERGNLTEDMQLKESGDMAKKDVYTYDANSKKTGHTTFEDNFYTRDTYDSKGNKVKTVTNSKGLYDGKVIYRYDNKGNLIDKISYDQLNKAFEKTEYVFF